ncbi:MAG TPA: DUF4394 domain-containing protein [Blastocatellia bacterium]|nr:DUF4394 domain-containing protein [Blastocatellia bacterium]
MQKAAFFLSAIIAASLLIGAPAMSEFHARRAPAAVATEGEGQVIGITHQSGLEADLLNFWSPDTPQGPVSSKPVTGLEPGEKIGGIAFDPDAAKLIGITNIGKVVFIDPKTGAAMQITHVNSNFVQGKLAVDYDPVTRLLRIMSESGFEVDIDLSRVPPIINIDTLPPYANGDANAGKLPKIIGLAGNQLPGTSDRRLFVIDAAQSVLAVLEGFRLKTIGALGIKITSAGGFAVLPGTPFGLAALQREGEETLRFYFISLLNGRAFEIGPLSVDRPVDGLAILISLGPMECHIDPKEAVNPVGAEHSITITVTGGQLDNSNVSILVLVDKGPNADTGASGNTGDDNVAVFKYRGTGGTGTDVITVAVTHPNGKTAYCEAMKTWFEFGVASVSKSGKDLVVTGCCFQAGDTILINDVAQKTRSDPDNPTTVLIGKKGFKKLEACSANFTNRIYIRREEPGHPITDTNAFNTCP